VQAAAAELDYKLPIRQSSNKRDIQKVAIVVPFIGRWYFAQIIEGVEAVMRERGIEAVVFRPNTSSGEIVSIADIPSNGSGLGSSSAFSVGLVHALNTFLHDSYVYSAVDVAETACKIEIDMNRSPIGKQDQYAVALGGLNQLVFNKDESVSISPINLDNYIETLLFDCILIFHTNLGRSTDKILSNTSQLSDEDKMSHLSEIKELTTKAMSIILNGEIDLLGKLVLENHKLKTLINENSKNELFESVLNYLIQKGGYGGKILGAGGGGFGLLMGPPEVLEKVKSEYDKIQFHRVSLDKFGSQVMFNDN
jgi:D-glycero-alpha-D-manno-heptose-7-phosphate kinase